MKTVIRTGKTAGNTALVVRVVAAIGVVLGGPVLLQALVPTIAMVTDIAVSVGHLCMAILRANGI